MCCPLRPPLIWFCLYSKLFQLIASGICLRSSILSVINTVSSAYLRWLILVLFTQTPIFSSSSSHGLNIHSEYMLNSAGDATQRSYSLANFEVSVDWLPVCMVAFRFQYKFNNTQIFSAWKQLSVYRDSPYQKLFHNQWNKEFSEFECIVHISSRQKLLKCSSASLLTKSKLHICNLCIIFGSILFITIFSRSLSACTIRQSAVVTKLYCIWLLGNENNRFQEVVRQYSRFVDLQYCQ